MRSVTVKLTEKVIIDIINKVLTTPISEKDVKIIVQDREIAIIISGPILGDDIA